MLPGMSEVEPAHRRASTGVSLIMQVDKDMVMLTYVACTDDDK